MANRQQLEKNWYKYLRIMSWYAIYADGKCVEEKIKTWEEAIKRARLWTRNLFNQPRKVEILNCYTGEIIDIAEAEQRIKAHEIKCAYTKGRSQ